jgi:hypothetical protein
VEKRQATGSLCGAENDDLGEKLQSQKRSEGNHAYAREVKVRYSEIYIVFNNNFNIVEFRFFQIIFKMFKKLNCSKYAREFDLDLCLYLTAELV